MWSEVDIEHSVIKINLSFCFPKQKYAPSVFEKYVTTISLGGKEIKLNLYDTAGKKNITSLLQFIPFLLFAQHISLLDPSY